MHDMLSRSVKKDFCLERTDILVDRKYRTMQYFVRFAAVCFRKHIDFCQDPL